MELLQSIAGEIFDWFKFFRGPDWILPVLGAVAAATYLGYKIRQMRQEMADDFVKVIGNFRSELSKLLVSAEASLGNSAKKAGDSLAKRVADASKAVSTEELEAKKKAAKDAEAAIRKLSASDNAQENLADDRESEINWAEIAAGWSEVWQWIKDLRLEAIDHEKGRAKGYLKQLDLRSPNEVILKLYNYGWFGDHASDLALEMAAIYMQHRGRARASTKAVKRFRELFRDWNSMS